MIVYGDPQFTQTLRGLLTGVTTRIETARGLDVEEFRALLIQSGQLEQAVQDRWPDPNKEIDHLVTSIKKLTDQAAASFCAAWAGTTDQITRTAPDRLKFLEELTNELTRMQGLPDVSLKVKVP